jgi:hypothetical protein
MRALGTRCSVSSLKTHLRDVGMANPYPLALPVKKFRANIRAWAKASGDVVSRKNRCLAVG